MSVATLGRINSRCGISGPSYCRLRIDQDRLKHKATGSPEALATRTQPRCLWGRTAEVTDRPPDRRDSSETQGPSLVPWEQPVLIRRRHPPWGIEAAPPPPVLRHVGHLLPFWTILSKTLK